MKIYDAEKDAVGIIEQIFHRQNWQPDLRDNLTERLERVVAREVSKRVGMTRNE